VPLSRSNLPRLRLTPGSTEAYGFAVLCIALASLIRWGIGLFAGDGFVFASYYPAVLFATYAGGAVVGGFAALLSAVIGWWAFIPPHFAFTPFSLEINSRLLAFLLASALIIWGADRYRRLLTRLEEEEELRNLAVSELAHRLKNKIATIQSVISAKLRDDPQTRNAIISLLSSLSATDDLIMATQGQGASFRDILNAEVGPYDISRISMQGPDVFLPPKLAMTLALVLHELATNAAKYGALAGPVGKLDIRWALSDRRMTIDWRESDGPVIGPMTHRGFGTQLLSRALSQFDGTIDSQFQPTGLICAMSLAVPSEPDLPAPIESGHAKAFEPKSTAVLPLTK
jgi:two-component sensor histidine kinase